MKPRLQGARVLVAGAGVFGSSIALVLAQAGACVTVADPAATGDNASGVAAGMLAPAFEALLDPAMAGQFERLRMARNLWPAFLQRLNGADIGMRKAGAIWVGGDLDAREQAMTTLGARTERLTAAQLTQRLPGVAATQGGIHTDDDWRLNPAAALIALRGAAIEAGAAFVGQSLSGFAGGIGRLADGATMLSDMLVIATGAAPCRLAPELAGLRPIKGHILNYPTLTGWQGPTLRFDRGYIVGGADGLHIGATMEAGLDDRTIDAAAVARLQAMGEALYPDLSAKIPFARAAVRAATADGFPLVGPSSQPGVLLAVGARRNGWLLAPLVAAMTAAYLAGGDPGPDAPLFEARRFAAV